ncbi:glycerol dehydratase reactivase beta/small subunit family protein [Prauserella cavernicola]|uniref:Glycerol dehydratase reactivase beta/small subunit family protein n=1 Tax=Prauserella cavernicola TaxID=2800127 RepID=A0A934QN90_9PSEU|nr:glycerol dehydratase reactivase beta/small subunit family protein [Prauserella cavernicola]MBK1783315.1 glycerol dehydratase reactivase beta/small subunit family protein [Prauserella cavernicola]
MGVRDRGAATTTRAVPPAIVVRCAEDAAAVLRDVLAGVEEEGVPVRVELVPGGDARDAATLAFAAARASSLDVGVGIDREGAGCVQHAKRPEDRPALTGPRERARLLGHNAARLVTGIPVKT